VNVEGTQVESSIIAALPGLISEAATTQEGRVQVEICMICWS
jgi:hypothetical protein